MKKSLSILLIVVFPTLFSIAQVNLEHTFTSSGFGTWHFNTENETFYYNANANTHKVYIYHGDYSLYKTIDLTPPSGYNLYWVYYPSKHLFNDDELIEFILVFYNSSNYIMKAYNENMSLVKDLGAAANAYVFNTQEGYKLKTTNWVYNAGNQNMDYTDKIYSLPGELYVSDSEYCFEDMDNKPYPNPAANSVTLPYQIKPDEVTTLYIYNLQGILIESKTIHGNFDHLRLNTNNYLSGSYLYKYNEKVASFIVR